MNLYGSFRSKLNEAIEPKYYKSNENYNKFLRDVKYYTGSYEYKFGGKVSAEYNGVPVRVDYFYYLRPFSYEGYNICFNVLTPMEFNPSIGEVLQEKLKEVFKPYQDSRTPMTQREIKDKILKVINEESLNESDNSNDVKDLIDWIESDGAPALVTIFERGQLNGLVDQKILDEYKKNLDMLSADDPEYEKTINILDDLHEKILAELKKKVK